MRITSLLVVAAAVGVSAAALPPSFHRTAPVVTVYKSPTCGCCEQWVEHMRAAGFTVKAVDVADVSPYMAELGVPRSLASCHTAIVDGYVIEGHVPADLVHKLLKERPKIAGLAVPGMVTGSPGMEGNRKDPYDVIAFDLKGKTAVYAKR
ncbi:MAG TPA: DUF411 domain-containing protein [Gemmatimonadales bacterium]|nr:DUF411 domain-containing protein [Gemmatimonadales bacterium]